MIYIKRSRMIDLIGRRLERRYNTPTSELIKWDAANLLFVLEKEGMKPPTHEVNMMDTMICLMKKLN